MKISPGTLAPGIFLAGIAAGPLFIIIGLLAEILTKPGRSFPAMTSEIWGFLLFLLLTSFFGTIIALPVNALGSALMMKLGERTELAHSRLVWTFAGGLISLFAGLLMNRVASDPFQLSLVLTSAICGRICRKDVVWLDENGNELPDQG